MKRIMLLAYVIIIFSGCVLISDLPSTPAPTVGTQVISTLPPTATVEKTPTLETQSPTAIPTFEKTSVPTLSPTITYTPQFTATPYQIILQPGSPAYIKNYAHVSEECNWLGVAGQIFNKEGNPIINKVVMIKGKIDGKSFEKIGVTGIPEADIYGPGGYEIKISDTLFNSAGLLSIQAFDLNGIPISDLISFSTFADCAKNLIIINFQFK